EGCLVAAGLEKFFVINPNKRTLERWDLETQTREADSPLDFTPPRHGIAAIGRSAHGPLVVLTGEKRNQRFEFLDANTLKPMQISPAGKARQIVSEGRHGLRMSANGKVFT